MLYIILYTDQHWPTAGGGEMGRDGATGIVLGLADHNTSHNNNK